MNLPLDIHIPSKYSISFISSDNDSINTVSAGHYDDWLLVQYPGYKYTAKHKISWDSTGTVGNTLFSLLNVGSLLCHYKYGDNNVYVRRMGSAYSLDRFLYLYISYIPENSIFIMYGTHQYLKMEDALTIVKDIAFKDVQEKWKFIELVDQTW